MCRNITTLRGLEPAATDEEIVAAARQFVRKVTGVQSVSAATAEPLDRAVDEIAAIVTRLLDELPERRRPPATVPPLRRPEVRARLGMPPFGGDEADHDHPHDHDGHAHDHADGHTHPHDHVHA
ncbi:DUF2277 domain-containing protein [Cellulosimicrobium cellulans]|uniref:DUF2277 domain-containing protein n=1 Tax=Cellulosimicrobium cellulans TaxID=1710 RepID=UPI00130E93CC|nr:DUF2277 domain-containing protein [Cellulosimicrobium cellulans]